MQWAARYQFVPCPPPSIVPWCTTQAPKPNLLGQPNKTDDKVARTELTMTRTEPMECLQQQSDTFGHQGCCMRWAARYQFVPRPPPSFVPTPAAPKGASLTRMGRLGNAALWTTNCH